VFGVIETVGASFIFMMMGVSFVNQLFRNNPISLVCLVFVGMLIIIGLDRAALNCPFRQIE
jgi:hypothetical protein